MYKIFYYQLTHKMSIILTDKLSVYASIPYFLRTRDTTIYKSLEIAYAGNFCGTLYCYSIYRYGYCFFTSCVLNKTSTFGTTSYVNLVE